MNRVLLRLYPADFRRLFGEELVEAYREATEGAGRGVRLRESADVVAQGLRLRLGIGSAHRGGRLLAASAPFALAATAAYAAFNLVGTVGDWYVIRGAGASGSVAPLMTLLNAGYVLTLIGAVVALAGRYLPGALCALAGTVGSALGFLDPIWRVPPALDWPLMGCLFAPILVASLALGCPPDLRPVRRARGGAGVLAVVMWAVLLVAALVVIDPLGLGLLFHWRFGVPLAAALLLVGRQAFARINSATQLACAASPFVITLHFSGWGRSGELLAIVAALAVIAAVLRLRRGGGQGTVNPA
ncbi:hypothetical protein [Streptomyces sp. NPDC048111]|uniref:hypothetical protein n=1 Tax=Streptomyces sp. NPDC048111 TaxID=3365500 RepID=UPI0037220327